jgi:peptidoglycan/LPS O-acetylase OafA/YrhL
LRGGCGSSAAPSCNDYSGSWVSRLLPASGTSLWLHAIRTDTRIDGLLLGCALALLLRNQPVRSFIFRNFPKETPLLCGCLLLPITQHAKGLPTFFGYLLISLALCSTLVVHEGLAYTWLSSAPLRWVGRISFSLYVWQQLFLMHPDGSMPMGFFGRAPFNILFAFAAASASYYWIERPGLRIGYRVHPKVNAPPAEGAEMMTLNA